MYAWRHMNKSVLSQLYTSLSLAQPTLGIVVLHGQTAIFVQGRYAAYTAAYHNQAAATLQYGCCQCRIVAANNVEEWWDWRPPNV